MEISLLRVGISKKLYPKPAYIFGINHYMPIEMEKEALAKLMVLKGLKGYGNKRVLDIVKSSNNLDSTFDLFIKKSIVTENDLTKHYDMLIDCERNKINIITYFDRSYPENLKLINSHPLMLFTKGNLSLLSKPSISVIGTRQASNSSLF